MSPSSRPEAAPLGEEVPEQQLRDCRKRAMDLMARREHGRVELESKLRQRGFADEQIGPVLDRLQSEGLLGDLRFAEGLVVSRSQRGQGPVRIEAELVQKGVAADIAHQAVTESDCDWPLLARQVRSKKFGDSPPTSFQERARQARFLTYRGFSPDQVSSALELVVDTD